MWSKLDRDLNKANKFGRTFSEESWGEIVKLIGWFSAVFDAILVEGRAWEESEITITGESIIDSLRTVHQTFWTLSFNDIIYFFFSYFWNVLFFFAFPSSLCSSSDFILSQ